MLRIKQLRESQGKSQKEVSVDLGVSQATVSGWESGLKTPSAKSTLRIAKYFKVSVDYLLGLTDENEGPLSEIGEEALDDELISRVKALSPEDRQKVDYFVQGIEAVRGAEASPTAGERKSPL